MTTKTDHGREQAEAQLAHIVELMEWLDHAGSCTDEDCGTVIAATRDYGTDDITAHDVDAATEAITENALDVEVREDWHAVGYHESFATTKQCDASEFRILLCTGGPAVRIMGKLDEHGTPDRAWLEYQDWGTPWIMLVDGTFGPVLRYAQRFYFGE